MLLKLYKALLKAYGKQNWWPATTKNKQYETIIGAILTQNTSWKNVEKALKNLKKLDCINPKKLLSLKEEELKKAIKPAGYYNQKTRYLVTITRFYIALGKKTPTRQQLLAIKGIGPETADTILLYAYKQPEFVVDAYTKRILNHLKIIKSKATYTEIKHLFETTLPKDVKLYKEFHALIVEHAKQHYSKKPHGKNDKLLQNLKI